MNTYLTDEVDIITVTDDSNGVESTSVQSGVLARVSEKNKLLVDVQGKEVVGKMHVLLAAGAAIETGYRMRVKKICGAGYSMPLKEWQVIQTSNAHSFSAHHVEVWVGEGA